MAEDSGSTFLAPKDGEGPPLIADQRLICPSCNSAYVAIHRSQSNVGVWAIVLLLLAFFTCGFALLLAPFLLVAMSSNPHYQCQQCGYLWTPKIAARLRRAQLRSAARLAPPDWLPVAIGSAGALALTLLIVGTPPFNLAGFGMVLGLLAVSCYFYWPR